MDSRDPRALRAGAIEEAWKAANTALGEVRLAVEYLAVVDRPAAEKKEWVVKAVVDLLDHLENKT